MDCFNDEIMNKDKIIILKNIDVYINVYVYVMYMFFV